MSQPWTPPPPPVGAVSTIPNNMVLAIIATVVSFMGCCLPHGIVSLIFAMQVAKKEAAGDLEGARDAAKKAKMFAWISIILAVVGVVLSFIFGVFAGIMSALSQH